MGRLESLSDAQVVAGAQLSVWGYLHLADGPIDGVSTIIDYSVQDIGGKDGLPGTAVMSHTVRSGDSLQSIAAAYFGSPSYWYLIADANGLTGSEELTAGTRLTIPNKVANAVSDKETYKVYNESDIIGSTSPQIRVKQKKKSWFQKLVTILIIVVIVVAAVYLAAFAAGAIVGALGTGAAGAGAAAGVAGSAGFALGGAIAGAVGGAGIGAALAATVALAAIGYVAGYAVGFATQGLAIAADLQDGFNWTAMQDMGKDFAVTAVAAGLGEWANTAGNWSYLIKGGIAAGSQAARNDGKVTNYSGVAAAMLPGTDKLGKDHWLHSTAKAVETVGANNVSAGLAVLEASIRGEDKTMSWMNMAASAMSLSQPTSGQFRYFNGDGLNWNAVAGEALVAGGLSMIVGDKFGEDAALNFFGAAMGNTVAGSLMEYERYQPIGAAISGNAQLQEQFNAINGNKDLTAQQRAGQLNQLKAEGEAYQAQQERMRMRAELTLPTQRDEFGQPIESEESRIFKRLHGQVAFHRSPEEIFAKSGGGSASAVEPKGKHVIGKGDTFWGVAEGLLSEELGRAPTTTEIQQRSDQLQALNAGMDAKNLNVGDTMNVGTSDGPVPGVFTPYDGSSQFTGWEMRATPEPSTWEKMKDTPYLGSTMRAGISFADNIISGFGEVGNLASDGWNYLWDENRSVVTGEFFPDSQLVASVQNRGLLQTGGDMVYGVARGATDVLGGLIWNDPERVGSGLAFWAPGVSATKLFKGGVPNTRTGSAADHIYENMTPVSDMFPDLEGVNPHYVPDAGPGVNTNCVSCANATQDRLLGKDPNSTASPSDGYGSPNDLLPSAPFGFGEATTRAGVEAEMLQAGNGASGVVRMQQGGPRVPEHVINVTVRDGKVYFIDMQTGHVVVPKPDIQMKLGLP